jgi:hypothetical protein
MIGNYTHKEWEATPKNFEAPRSHQLRLGGNEGSLSSMPKTNSAVQKDGPPDNTGSEPVETSKKGKAGKAVVTTESSSKLAKASEALAQWKAAAADVGGRQRLQK